MIIFFLCDALVDRQIKPICISDLYFLLSWRWRPLWSGGTLYQWSLRLKQQAGSDFFLSKYPCHEHKDCLDSRTKKLWMFWWRRCNGGTDFMNDNCFSSSKICEFIPLPIEFMHYNAAKNLIVRKTRKKTLFIVHHFLEQRQQQTFTDVRQ